MSIAERLKIKESEVVMTIDMSDVLGLVDRSLETNGLEQEDLNTDDLRKLVNLAKLAVMDGISWSWEAIEALEMSDEYNLIIDHACGEI